MIRLATVADVPQILEIYGPYVENTAISFEYTVPSQESFTQRFLSYTRQFPWLVWEEEGRILGYAYGSAPFERAAYQWCAEASIYMRPECRGKGMGKRLYYVLEQLMKLQGYGKVYSLITTANEASIRFHEAAGYRHMCVMPDCGFKQGAWYGVVWMEKILNNLEKPVESPIPMDSIVDIDRKLQNILDKMPLSL